MNLNDLGENERVRVLAGARRAGVARGEMLYTPEDMASEVFFVETGRVKIVRTRPSGDETILGIRTPGDIFGELSWMQPHSRRDTSAVAIDAGSMFALTAGAFDQLLAQHAVIAEAFVRGIARRLSETVRELAEQVGKSVPGRLVDVLGRLASEHGVDETDGTMRIALNLTHQDLADLIGTSRETLTRELAVLADIGLLRVSHKTIALLQPQAFPFVAQRRSSPR